MLKGKISTLVNKNSKTSKQVVTLMTNFSVNTTRNPEISCSRSRKY